MVKFRRHSFLSVALLVAGLVIGTGVVSAARLTLYSWEGVDGIAEQQQIAENYMKENPG